MKGTLVLRMETILIFFIIENHGSIAKPAGGSWEVSTFIQQKSSIPDARSVFEKVHIQSVNFGQSRQNFQETRISSRLSTSNRCSTTWLIKCNNGHCISTEYLCNKRDDCFDNSDEKRCLPASCDSKRGFTCANSEYCIPFSWVCDGLSDCMDGSDERNCSPLAGPPPCKQYEFQCSDRKSCVYFAKVCDRRPDCEDSSDEKLCFQLNPGRCVHDKFVCSSGECLPLILQCNGVRECSDGSDEMNCGEPTTTTSTRAPTTSTRAPTTSTRAPTTSTRAPTTSTRAPTTSTRAPTTSTRAPTTSTRTPMTTTTTSPLPTVKSSTTTKKTTSSPRTTETTTISELSTIIVTPTSIDPTSQPPSDIILIGAFCGTFFLGVCIVLVLIQLLRKRKKAKAVQNILLIQWTKKITIQIQESSGEDDTLLLPLVKIENQKMEMSSNTVTDGMQLSEYDMPRDDFWEFPRQNLILGETLGEGNFGKVVRAEANGIMKPGTVTSVAVKMLKESHSDVEMMQLVCEMELMKLIGQHVNIINLLGVCTQGGPLYVIVELALYNNLKDFLNKHRPSTEYQNQLGSSSTKGIVLTERDLISFALQVAHGMQYLHSRKCIHRDLAARNVLVSDNLVMKIADFGLARDVHTQDYYRKTTQGMLPVKWMAPESLFQNLYTYRSDVWSYGILLWEIMSFGDTPYPSNPNWDGLCRLLRSGQRMNKPDLCSDDVYGIMRDCWCFEAADRPEFGQLVSRLSRLLVVNRTDEAAVGNKSYVNVSRGQGLSSIRNRIEVS